MCRYLWQTSLLFSSSLWSHDESWSRWSIENGCRGWSWTRTALSANGWIKARPDWDRVPALTLICHVYSESRSKDHLLAVGYQSMGSKRSKLCSRPLRHFGHDQTSVQARAVGGHPDLCGCRRSPTLSQALLGFSATAIKWSLILLVCWLSVHGCFYRCTTWTSSARNVSCDFVVKWY